MPEDEIQSHDNHQSLSKGSAEAGKPEEAPAIDAGSDEIKDYCELEQEEDQVIEAQELYHGLHAAE